MVQIIDRTWRAPPHQHWPFLLVSMVLPYCIYLMAAVEFPLSSLTKIAMVDLGPMLHLLWIGKNVKDDGTKILARAGQTWKGRAR